MRGAILLAGAMVIAACHNRNDDQAGPAPDTDANTPATHAIDTTRTGPPGEAGRPTNATVTLDSVGVNADSAAVVDSSGAVSPSPTSVPQDTLGPSSIDSTSADTSSYR